FARDAPQARPAGSDFFADRLDRGYALVVGADHPYCVDFRIAHHRGDVVIHGWIADPQASAERGDLLAPRRALAVDGGDVRIAHPSPALDVKARHKPCSNNAYSKPFSHV